MTSPQATEIETRPESRNPAVPPGIKADRQPGRRLRRQLEQLLVRFSQPSSQISGRIVGLFGTLLVIATLVLGLIHMLGTVDFVATMAAGAVLYCWSLGNHYGFNRAQRAAEEVSAGE